MRTVKLIFLICFFVQFQMNASNPGGENANTYTFSVLDITTPFWFSIEGPYSVNPDTSYQYHLVNITGTVVTGSYSYKWFVHTTTGWRTVGYNTGSTSSVEIEFPGNFIYVNQGYNKILLKCEGFNTTAGQAHTEYFTPTCSNCRF